MGKGPTVVVVVIAAAVLGVAVYVLLGGRGSAPIADAVKEMVGASAPADVEKASDKDAATKPAESGRAAAARKADPRPDRSGRAGATTTPPPSAQPSEPAKPVVAPVSAPAADPPRPTSRTLGTTPRRVDTFVAGNRSGWIGFDIALNRPLRVRAGGVIRAGDEVSGPGGLPEAGRDDLTRRVRALPGAPYLALIGRVCSADSCSPPFLIGANTVLCPSEVGMTGDLQLWTNNYVQVDGYQTMNSYTRAAGGFRFQAEPAPAAACEAAARKAPPNARPNEPPIELADGDVLKDPSFFVSSRQNAWKPFFLPLDRPLLIRASGEMQPTGRLRATGPNGFAGGAGAPPIVVDSQHELFDQSLPYQALIGRLCSSKVCGEPFLVGTERTVCPHLQLNERLELWINHIVPRTGELYLPFADLTFQSRRGEYRFDVIGAPAGACRK